MTIEVPPQLIANTNGAWSVFIKDGTPKAPTMPEWPPYDLERRATMEIDVVSRVVDDPLSAERRLWEKADY